MTTRIFPKSDGQVFYGSDPNMTYFQSARGSTMNYNAISVGNTATVIKAINADRKIIVIKNNDADGISVYLGDSGVTTANGYELKGGQEFYMKADTTAIYGIVASGTVDIRYLEVE